MLIVTIDGPAGAGKSTVARELARRLGFDFLDTGAMYRAVALAALRAGLDAADADGLEALARGGVLETRQGRVFWNGADVTDALRSQEVTAAVRRAADHPGVRALLVDLQRRVAAGGRYVTEGRDQGTVAFPDAPCKIFLTASAATRARRRWRELANRGEHADLEQLQSLLEARDAQDAARPVGRLAPAADAIEVRTDGLSVEQVVDRLEALARRRLAL